MAFLSGGVYFVYFVAEKIHEENVRERERIYQIGFKAGEIGIPVQACPYESENWAGMGGYARRLWIHGWTNGRAISLSRDKR